MRVANEKTPRRPSQGYEPVHKRWAEVLDESRLIYIKSLGTSVPYFETMTRLPLTLKPDGVSSFLLGYRRQADF